MTNIQRKAAAWAAILSMALQALWPLLAGANPGTPEPFGTEVCTAHGLLAVYDSEQQLPSPAGPSHRLLPHCAFCTLGSGHAAVHSAGLLALQSERPLEEVPAAYRFAIRPWFLSASLRARSPPA
jgi:Protein of unknown function (DUF2946)